MNKLRNYLLVLAVLAGIAWGVTSIYQKNNDIGASVVSRYKTTLASSMTSNQTTVPVSSITTFDGHVLTMADVGSRVFLTIEPGSVREEIVACTAITSSQWSSCTRGLAFYGTSTVSVAANQKAHNAGAIVVMSNVHYVYEELVDKDADETIGGQKTFSGQVTFGVIPYIPTTTPTSSGQVASKQYVDNVIAAGAPDGTEGVKGIWEGATQAEMAAGTILGGTSAGLVIQSRYATTTRTGTGNFVVVTAGSGYVSSTFGGVAFSMATLDSNALVVQNPVSARETASTSSMPITPSATSTLHGSWLGSSTAGSVFYVGSDGYAKGLSIGSVGQALVVSSTTGFPYYTNVSKLLGSTVQPITFTDNGSEQTVGSCTIPAGFLQTNRGVRMIMYISDLDDNAGSGNTTFAFKYGGTTIGTFAADLGVYGSPNYGRIEGILFASSTASAQRGSFTYTGGNSGDNMYGASGVASENSATALNLIMTWTGLNASSDITVEKTTCELL